MAKHIAAFYWINGITLYRLISAPFLLMLAFAGQLILFKWLLALSFLTDAVDGSLSRKFKVTSVFGARLDSIADDATVFVAAIALWRFHPQFMREHWISLVALLVLLVIQNMAALIMYGKLTSFHTYMAKLAAIAQAVFFFSIFLQYRCCQNSVLRSGSHHGPSID